MRGQDSEAEEQIIVKIHSVLGNRQANACTQLSTSMSPGNTSAPSIPIKHDELGLSRAMHESSMQPPNKTWDPANATSASLAGACSRYPASITGFQCGPSSVVTDRAESPWGQNTCSGGMCMAGDQKGQLHKKLQDENGEESEGEKEMRNGSNIFMADSMLWDLPSDNLMNPIV